MRILKKSILVMTLLTLLCGCKMGGIRGSGTRKTEKKELPAFKAIETGGAFDVEVTCQKPQSVEIEADDNLLPLLETDVADGVLHVGMKQNYHAPRLISLRIAVPDLNRITINGAGTVRVAGVKNENFVIHSNGAAKIQANGETKAVEIRNSGAGLIDAHELRSSKADVNLSGAGQAEVYASEQLDVTISGVGRVTYSGQPKVINKNISGIGSVSARD